MKAEYVPSFAVSLASFLAGVGMMVFSLYA